MNLKMMIILIVVVLIIVGGGVVAVLLLTNSNNAPPPEETPEASVVVSFTPGDFFVTNLYAGKDGVNHLVRLAVTLKLDSIEYLEALTEHAADYQPSIREAILFVLRKMTAEELIADDNNNQVMLRASILEAVNQAMHGMIVLEHERGAGGDHFTGVIISDLVIQ